MAIERWRETAVEMGVSFEALDADDKEREEIDLEYEASSKKKPATSRGVQPLLRRGNAALKGLHRIHFPLNAEMHFPVGHPHVPMNPKDPKESNFLQGTPLFSLFHHNFRWKKPVPASVCLFVQHCPRPNRWRPRT